MPELPEVETTRRGLSGLLVGHRVSAVRIREGRLREPVQADLDQWLVGRRLAAIGRRAKYLLLDFEGVVLLIHLGMSGSLRVAPADDPPRPHEHLDIGFGDRLLRYRDPRRFGRLLAYDPGAGEPAALAGLGIEPLAAEFDGDWLHRASRGRRMPIKPFLMDGSQIVGVGNIYASESLHRAGVDPRTPAGRLSRPRCGWLADSIRSTLAEAIEAGGSSLRDFVGGDGRPGYFQHAHRVYAREGEACPACGAPITRIVMAQRATYFCRHCQRR